MDTLLAVTSFPFWFCGFFLVVLGLWGTFARNGVQFEPGFTGRFATVAIGILFWVLAYLMISY